MDSEDVGTSSLNSTDTSQLLRELQALNHTLESGSTGTSFQGGVNSPDIGGSGDATITQLMQTMYNPQPKQKVLFSADEEEENSFGVFGREVDIYVNSTKDSPQAGSNKVKIKEVVKHVWDQRYYFGHLVAVHRDGHFVGFSLKSKSGGAVRILHNHSSDRSLLKGFGGNVVDVAFAHSPEAIIAAMDELGNLLVYSCELSNDSGDGKIIKLLLHLACEEEKISMYHRVIWCPYWPEEGEDIDGVLQDSSKMLAYTQGETIELLAVDIVTKVYGNGPIHTSDITNGKITLVSHSEPIVEAVFSPDGSALATASLDGEVKFFQIDWRNTQNSPMCLHHWKPHDGQPLSFFTFLDDLKNMSPDAHFWKFAITGCKKNRELKVWSCETWNCLQTIRFLPTPNNTDQELSLKAGIDLSARYIILSDRTNMAMYVLQVYQDAVAGKAHISSVTHFPLAQSCLSFAIIDAATKKFKASLSDSHLDGITTGELDQDQEGTDQSQNNCEDNEGESTVGVQIRLYAIHPRAMQMLLIRYRPESTVSMQGSAASVSHDGTSLRDGLSDVSVAAETSFADSEAAGDDLPAAPPAHLQPKLLSPDAFTVSSSSKMASPSGVAGANTTTEDVLSSTSSFTHVTGLTGQNAEDLLLSPASSADQSASAAAVLSPKSHTSAPSPKSSILSPKSPGSMLSPSSALSPKSLYSTPQGGQKGVETQEELTPTNVPLPPEEEDELATPKSSHHGNDSSQLDALEAFFKPSTSMSSEPHGEMTLKTGTFEVDTLPTDTASAAASARDSEPPTDAYDENDQEVAEVLGEDMDKSYSSGGSAVASGVAVEYPIDHTTDDDRPHKPWPRPPDVPTAQTEPDVSKTPPQAIDEDIQTLGAGDGEDNYSEDQNEAEVEEEIEEVIEEPDDDDDDDDEREEGVHFRKSYQELIDTDRSDGGPVHIIREVVDPAALSVLQESISKLTQEVYMQQQKLNHLQQVMAEQHEMQVDLQRQQLEQASLRSAAQPSKDLEQQLGRIQNVVASRVERTLSTTLQRETKMLHEKLSASEARQSVFQESLQKSITHTLSSATQKTLETAVKQEFKQHVTPAVNRSLEQLKNQLHTEMSQKITATDSVIKDQIGKLVRSRQTTEAIGQAVSNSVHSQTQALMRDMFGNRVIPAFEIASRSMMTQINASFQEGTTEYLGHLRKQLEKVRQEQAAARDPLVSQLTDLVESVRHNSVQLNEQIMQTVHKEINSQFKASLNSFQEHLQMGLRSVVRDEVSEALREQGSKMTDSLASYLRSGAGTPVPGAHTPDVNTLQANQDQIKHLVSRGKLDKAFQMALSASNLELVVYVCELVDAGDVFGPSPCPLSQPVLLSLVQQLSAELSSSFNVKLRYLTEAVTILDPRDPMTQEHIPVVLEGLITKLRTYQSTHAPNKDVRLLLMAVSSLLAS